ncbi:MAG: hypothetical protein AAFN92_03530, partial [Bacteroidota bacterium]
MQSIAVIGGGNLAWHLTHVLQNARREVVLLRRAAEQEDWPVPVFGHNWLDANTPNLVFLAVPDDHIYKVSLRLQKWLPAFVPVIHTSGATPVTRIDDHFRQRGALWPIRSLRRGEAVTDWR